jgi:DNA-directed RNA polymerase specialized sigma24 family protein
MASETPDRLSQIETAWDLLRAAQAGPADPAGRARERLLARYQRAVFAYLCGCVRDPDAAQELFQEFWLRFLEGAFRHADPGTGSFRKYVKAALSRMATRHSVRAHRAGGPVPADTPDPSPPPLLEEDGAAFQERWRQTVLGDTWEAMARAEGPGSIQYVALRIKADYPDRPDAELAALLSERVGRPVSHDNVRKILQRARDRFAEILYSVVAESLRDPSPDRVAEELGELELLRYCRSAVTLRSGGAG